jgi:hypothetical protein
MSLKIQATFLGFIVKIFFFLDSFFAWCTAIALFGFQREFGMVLGGGVGGRGWRGGGAMVDWQLWWEQTEDELEDFHVTQEPFPS